MANGNRSQWDYVEEMTATEFLNYFAYLSDKSKYEKQVMEDNKRQWKN